MICSNCGTENKAGRRFCVRCASPLAAVCPNCGSTYDPGDTFCGECAAPLGQAGPGPTGSPASRPAPPPVTERRLVSVLFADLVGFTPFAEERDAEEVRETLSRYFEIASDAIGRHGGVVEKFIGDAVMAVWGAPVAREDDAERAVRAGLELVDAVAILGPTIQARAGVLTGEAAVTLGATNQGMVAGDLVNTAARLQGVAPPGSVLVGEATHRAASKAIVFEAAGEQLLKGKVSPVPAWRALRVVAEVGGRNRSDTLETPFVGREDELRLLKELFHATTREQRSRLVSVIGPAGIGKTRLAWEFLKYVDGLVETVWWHDGRSPAYGDGISFWALGEMVRTRCGLLETDDEPTTRAKVSAALDQHVPDPEERGWLEPALLTLLGIESEIGSDRLFGAWRVFFERLAATAPVVMVFEDLHYADGGLLDFVDDLLEWSRDVPIYVVTLARPELLEKRPDWGARKRTFNSLYLEPLTERSMRDLINGLVPGLAPAALKAIVARAGGIPLYAVETVRMLLADGKVQLEGDVYVPTGDLTDLAVPETLTALIAARLDALAPDDRALVQAAAVLGQSFTLAGLAAVTGIEAETLERRLPSLVRGELLTVEADPRSPERGQYAFVQALIRDVAYGTLAKRDRKANHLAAARFFESLGSGELAGALAGQYLAAYRLAAEGPEATALASQARITLRAAADRAASLGSQDQAVAFLEQALKVTTDAREQAELLEAAGVSASLAGRHEEAEAFLRRAVEVLRTQGDRPGVARAISKLGKALITARHTDVALRLLEPTSVEFADLAEDASVAMIGGQLARAYYLSGEHRRAVEVADRVLEVAEHADVVDVIADTLVTRGSALVEMGRSEEGIALLRAGHELAEARGFTDTLGRAATNWSMAEFTRRPAVAMEIARAGLASARRLGDRAGANILLGNVASVGLRTGDWQQAIDELEGLLAGELETSDRAEALDTAIMFRAFRGEPIDEHLADSERLLAGATDPYRMAILHDTRGAVAFAGGRLREAYDQWKRAGDVVDMPLFIPMAARPALWDRDTERLSAQLAALDASGLHGPAIEADRTTMRAGLAALQGRTAESLGMYRDALRAWRDLRLPWDEAMCAIDMATVLDPSEPEVRAAADAAREILSRLGARPFLERLEAAVTRSQLPGPAPGVRPHARLAGDVEIPAVHGKP